MTRRRRHILVGITVAVMAAATGIVAVHLSGAAAAPAPVTGDGEMPTALSRHLEKLHQALPGDAGMSREGPASAADAAFAERAYPSDTISIAQVERAKRSFDSAFSRPFPVNKAKQGVWSNVGPSQALYPDSEFRNSFNYVPNEYVAGGRTTSIAISHVLPAVHLPRLDHPGRRRRLGHPRTSARAEPEVGLPRWSAGHQRGRRGHHRPQRPDSGSTIYVGTGEANICGSGCVAGVGLYKSTNGGLTWTGPDRQERARRQGHRRDRRSSRATPRRSTSAPPPRCAACRASAAPASPGRCRTRRSGACTRPPTAARPGRSSTTARPTPAECTGSAAEFANTAVCSPRGVRHVELDPSNPNIVYASSYARGVWRSSDAGATWTQIKPSLNAGGDPDPRRRST